MTVPAVIVLLGTLLFLLGILGGSISLKEVSLPPVSARLRVVLIPLNLVMMALGVWLSLGGTISLPSRLAPQPQGHAPEPSAGEPAATAPAPAALPAPSPTTSGSAAQLPYYEREGTLLYEEDFEDGRATGRDGDMEIIQLADGNHVVRSENDHARYSLPGGVIVRVIAGECCTYYVSYIRFPWLTMVENTPL